MRTTHECTNESPLRRGSLNNLYHFDRVCDPGLRTFRVEVALLRTRWIGQSIFVDTASRYRNFAEPGVERERILVVPFVVDLLLSRSRSLNVGAVAGRKHRRPIIAFKKEEHL